MADVMHHTTLDAAYCAVALELARLQGGTVGSRAARAASDVNEARSWASV